MGLVGLFFLFALGVVTAWISVRRWTGRSSPEFLFGIGGFCCVWAAMLALLGLALPYLVHPTGPFFLAGALLSYGPYMATAAVEIGAMLFQPSAARSSPAAAALSKALREMHAGRMDMACARFEEALVADPGLAATYMAYASALRKAGLRNRAMGVLETGIERAEIGGGHVDLVRLYVEWLVAEERLDEARAAAARARRRYEEESGKVAVLQRQEDIARAVSALDDMSKAIGRVIIPPAAPAPEKLDVD
ncbi:MAG: hypothetical protein N3A38_06965 [Planctomycetota bacterium]|nr:hypothetical protein [Planctomycetota bacterium]